jgi:hypothetical protein
MAAPGVRTGFYTANFDVCKGPDVPLWYTIRRYVGRVP